MARYARHIRSGSADPAVASMYRLRPFQPAALLGCQLAWACFPMPVQERPEL